MAAAIRGLGALALNRDAETIGWTAAPGVVRARGWEWVFVRPEAESKEFAGWVFELEELAAFVDRLQAVGHFETGESAALVGPALPLGRERRAFVVDGRAVSISQYAQGGQPRPRDGAPLEVEEFVAQVVATYAPAPCFVVDVAETVRGGASALAAVEFNSINSSGFYRCDRAAIVEAISRHVMRGD